jgi:hypothetical protein
MSRLALGGRAGASWVFPPQFLKAQGVWPARRILFDIGEHCHCGVLGFQRQAAAWTEFERVRPIGDGVGRCAAWRPLRSRYDE